MREKKESHNHEKEIVAVAPTCTETGVLHLICECGHTEESVIEALGHLYGDAVWEWADDHGTATVRFYCQRFGFVNACDNNGLFSE